MWNAISNMIIKAADNMNRGVENAGEAGDGNNGQNYQISTSSNESGTSGYKPVEQDTSGADSLTNNLGKISDMGKSALSKIGTNNEKPDDESQKGVETSDERLKNIFGDNEDAIKCFAKIDAIRFTYNDKAKEIHPGEENGVDGDVHFGVKAQDLEENPLTASAVSEDTSGFKQVDTQELTMANSAVISEICKRIEIIENVLGIKVV